MSPRIACHKHLMTRVAKRFVTLWHLNHDSADLPWFLFKPSNTGPTKENQQVWYQSKNNDTSRLGMPISEVFFRMLATASGNSEVEVKASID